jgi:putative transposase
MNNRNSKKAINERKNPLIRHGRHCVYNLHVHLVFVTKYRRMAFTTRVLKELEDIFHSVCQDLESQLIEFSGEGDHCHLLVNYPPKMSVSKLVNLLKGVSSRIIRSKNFPEVRSKLWGKALWTPSYFASSCGGVSIDIVRKYIEEQERPE